MLEPDVLGDRLGHDTGSADLYAPAGGFGHQVKPMPPALRRIEPAPLSPVPPIRIVRGVVVTHFQVDRRRGSRAEQLIRRWLHGYHTPPSGMAPYAGGASTPSRGQGWGRPL